MPSKWLALGISTNHQQFLGYQTRLKKEGFANQSHFFEKQWI